MLFLLIAVTGGVLSAGLLLPVVAASGAVTTNTADFFDALPTALEERDLSQQSRMWAADGSLLATFYTRNRIVVDFDEISDNIKKAVVAIEDSRFYEHGGVDVQGVARAMVNNITTESLQGASTLTQQYVKNVLIAAADAEGDHEAVEAARETSMARKLREMKLAIGVEQRLSKDEILGKYLNIAQFGRSTYGVEAAAQYYFGVKAKDLTIAQAATLAGVTQNPTKWDPERHPDDATTRRNIVLMRMLELDLITRAEYDKARALPVADMLDIHPTALACSDAGEIGDSAFFCDYVTKVITHDEAFGETRAERAKLLYRGGLDIYTTLDPEIQKLAQSEVMKAVPVDDPSGIAAAIVTVEPGTGKILAMAQNRIYRPGQGGEDGETAINYNTDQQFGGSNGFQPGSTFKPFVLAEWLQEGHSLNARVNASVRTYKPSSWVASCVDGPFMTRNWTPRNSSDGMASGSLRVIDATAKSVNTGFAAMAQQLDMCGIRDTAQNLGFHRADGRDMEVFPSIILGTQIASPLTMASSYAAFAAEGVYCEPIAISRITDAHGEEVAIPDANCREAVTPEVANAVTYALTKVFENGSGRGKGLTGRPAAGKTGTTNENVQSWFVGYTPQVSTAVWVGNSEGNNPMKKVKINGTTYRNVYGSTIALPAWRSYMQQLTEGMPVLEFPEVNEEMLHGARKFVPNVAGNDVETASDILRRAGFRAGEVTERESAYPAGTVIATSPSAHNPALPGTTVSLVVSSGPAPQPDNSGNGHGGPGDGNDGPGNGNGRGGPGGGRGGGPDGDNRNQGNQSGRNPNANKPGFDERGFDDGSYKPDLYRSGN